MGPSADLDDVHWTYMRMRNSTYKNGVQFEIKSRQSLRFSSFIEPVKISSRHL